MTLLQQYKQAKDQGYISYGEDSKPIYILPHPDRSGFVRIYHPHVVGMNSSTLEPLYEVSEKDYSPERLEQEWKPQQEKEIARLKQELADAEEDLALVDEFITDITPYVKAIEEEK